MRISLLWLVMASCGPLQTFPMHVHVEPAGHGAEYALLESYADQINRRVGCPAVVVTAGPAQNSVRWTTLTELSERFPEHGGVSVAPSGPWGIEIWIADAGPAPDSRPWAVPSLCEVGYLWVHWIAYFTGLLDQSNDPAHITYAHPSCHNGEPDFDFVGDLLTLLDANSINICR